MKFLLDILFPNNNNDLLVPSPHVNYHDYYNYSDILFFNNTGTQLLTKNQSCVPRPLLVYGSQSYFGKYDSNQRM